MDRALDGEYELWGSPHSHTTRELLRNRGIQHIRYEFLNDFTVFQKSAKGFEEPILACESEVNATQSVLNDLESGYIWDFRKLLFTSFPSKLFIGCVNESRGNTTGNRLDTLKESITSCAMDYQLVWSASQLHIFLYSSSLRQFPNSWVGSSQVSGVIEWQRLSDTFIPNS